MHEAFSEFRLIRYCYKVSDFIVVIFEVKSEGILIIVALIELFQTSTWHTFTLMAYTKFDRNFFNALFKRTGKF
jgi:hypothetical protein